PRTLRTHTHRPPARRPAAQSRSTHPTAGSHRPDPVAVGPHGRGSTGHLRRSQPHARPRQRGDPHRHHSRRQGPGVPGGVSAVRLGRQQAARRGRVTAARGRRSRARRRRSERSGLRPAQEATSERGSRRGSPAALRGADPRAVPCGRLVGADHQHQERSAEPAATAPVPSDSALQQVFTTWADGAISVEPLPAERVARRWQPAAEPHRKLAVATFDRRLDTFWRRASYSALTAAAHADQGVASETEERTTIDEPEPPEPTGGATGGDINPDRITGMAEGTDSPTASLMNELPAGAEFGTLVHAVLEEVDTSADDLAAEVRLRCAKAVARTMSTVDVAVLAHALTAALRTPIGRDTLADVAPADRLTELEFELPVAATVSVQRIAETIRTHLPADDPLAGYPDMLSELTPPPLRGFL